MSTLAENLAGVPSMGANSRRSRWRFGLRSMFLLTLFVAVALAIERECGVLELIAFLLFTLLFGTPIVFRHRTTPLEIAVCRSVAAYLVTSIATLPFLDDVWAGELPVLALLQAPKIEFAWWITNHIIYDVLRPMGWSSGSVSPDEIIMKPIGLALAYAIPIGIVYAIVVWRTRFAIRYRYWMAAIVALAVADYVMLRCFASGPGLTIY